MDQKYILVLWKKENKYSVVQHSKIERAEDKAKNEDDLVGTTIPVLWKAKKPYMAEIIQCGEKINLDYELSVLLAEQLEKSHEDGKRHKPSINSSTRDTIREILELQPEAEATDNGECNAELAEMRTKVEQLESKLATEKEAKRKYREKYRNLKRKHPEADSMEMKEIGEGVFLPASQLSTILAISNNSSKLARNLMGALYEEHELYNRSLFGIHCNANKNSVTRESVEPKRRDAIIGFVHRTYGGLTLVNGTKRKNDPLLLSLHSSLGDYLRYITKKCSAKTPNNEAN